MGKEIEELSKQADEALRVLGAEYSSKVHDIERYIEELEATQPRWISVKERLPEEGFYLVFHPRLGVTLGAYAKGSRANFWYIVHPELIASIEPIEFNKTPTHWMPLPPAPEGEE